MSWIPRPILTHADHHAPPEGLNARHGALMEEDTEIPYLANPDADPALAAPACGRLHLPHCSWPPGRPKVLAWKDPSLSLASSESPQSPGCVSAQGFSLHADTYCGPQQRQKLERLCRYITRPTLSQKRLRRTPAGDVVFQLKTPYREGTTHLVMTPLEFLQRLASLVPRRGGISFASMAYWHPMRRYGLKSCPARPTRCRLPPMGMAISPRLPRRLA